MKRNLTLFVVYFLLSTCVSVKSPANIAVLDNINLENSSAKE